MYEFVGFYVIQVFEEFELVFQEQVSFVDVVQGELGEFCLGVVLGGGYVYNIFFFVDFLFKVSVVYIVLLVELKD